MKEFIVKANGHCVVDNIVLIIFMLVVYIGIPLLLGNYYKTHSGDIVIACLFVLLGYSVATFCMYDGIKELTQVICFNESSISIKNLVNRDSFMKEDVTYEITYDISSQGIGQHVVLIKAGGKVVSIAEKKVINYPRAVEYLQNNCRKEKISK